MSVAKTPFNSGKTICGVCGKPAEWEDFKAGYSECTDRGHVERRWIMRRIKCLSTVCGEEYDASRNHLEGCEGDDRHSRHNGWGT